MKQIFAADNHIEAHLVMHQLQQAGIDASLRGEILQGGIGELPATGNVRVYVNARDEAAAREVIADWDSRMTAD